MRDLRLIGVHEDGQHLLLSDSDGERYRVRLDEPLRAAARRDRPRLGQLQIEIDGGMRPREVQALIRAGLSAEEVADRAGWTPEKVRRYEGPILAEREHVAGLARGVRLRARSGGASGTPTLAARVSQRLSARGVDPAMAEWDSARSDEGEWTVLLTFPAGGRERQARWAFDVAARTVSALDDEARWLSEDESAGADSPLPAPHLVSTPVRATTVYDVEAEGGLTGQGRTRPAGSGVGGSSTHRTEEPLDLMSAMRERASHRGRPRRRKSPPTQTPLDEAPREDALPLEELHYDPETMPPPPAARGEHPLDAARAESTVGDDVLPAAPSEPQTPDEADTEPADSEDTVAVEAQDTGPVDAQQAEPGEDEHDKPVDRHEPVETDESDEADEAEGASQRVSTRQASSQDEPSTDEPAHDEGGQQKAGTNGSEPLRPATRPARKPGRRSVPSWDDVMFGAKPGTD